MGRPIVEGHRAAVEFWTNMQNEGADVTLVGCLLLIFDDEGRAGASTSTTSSPRVGSSHPRPGVPSSG